MLLTFSSAILRRGKLVQMDGSLTHSQILSTFQDGGRVKFPTLGTVVDVKIPTHVRFTTSNSRGLPGPPILGQTIDRCINHASTVNVFSSKNSQFHLPQNFISQIDRGNSALPLEYHSSNESHVPGRDFRHKIDGRDNADLEGNFEKILKNQVEIF